MLFNDISLSRYDIRQSRMIYLRCKYDIISVPSYAEGIYHRTKCDIISKIYHPFRQERISLKKHAFVRRTKACFFMEQGTGIEPASEAWEATIIADIRTLRTLRIIPQGPAKSKQNSSAGFDSVFTHQPHRADRLGMICFLRLITWGRNTAPSLGWTEKAFLMSSSSPTNSSQVPSSSTSVSISITSS